MTTVDLRQLAELRHILLSEDQTRSAKIIEDAMQELITWRSRYAAQITPADMPFPRLSNEHPN